MLQLPIQVDQLHILLADEPRKSVEYTTKQQRTDQSGALLWDVPVVLLGPGGAQVARIRVPHEPKELKQGEMLRVQNLSVFYWETEGNSGISFRAERLERLTPGAPAKHGSPA